MILPPSIAKACSFIEKHCDDPLTLSDVANAVNMGAHYFSERFKQSTGLKFTEFVSLTRIERAKALLADPHLQVAEIAYQVGFQTLSQFNRAFRQITGTSPTHYRHSLAGTGTNAQDFGWDA